MTLGHPTSDDQDLLDEARCPLEITLLNGLLAEVLMLQGGASGQFASVPLNLLGSGDAQADYITTGQWLS